MSDQEEVRKKTIPELSDEIRQAYIDRMGEFFESIGIPGLTKDDSYTIVYIDGMLSMDIHRHDGSDQYVGDHQFRRTNKASQALILRHMTRDERNRRIREMYANGHTQSHIGKLFSLSPSSVWYVIHKTQ